MTGIIGWVAKVTPASVVRGIQAALGVLLAMEAIKLLDTGWLLGGVSIGIVLALRENRYAPAAVVLVVLGAALMFANGQLGSVAPPGLSLPPVTTFTLREVWDTLLLAGFAQIPLTITNATIATAALIRTYWPDRPVTERKLSWNQGIMNAVTPFFGGMPMCHGAGGLAGQYYFGARTGGTNIIEGAIEISLGCPCGCLAGTFSAFPAAIIGAMMFLVGLELTKFVRDVRIGTDMIPLSATLIIATSTNMAYGFLAGLASHYLISFLSGDKDKNP